MKLSKIDISRTYKSFVHTASWLLNISIDKNNEDFKRVFEKSFEWIFLIQLHSYDVGVPKKILSLWIGMCNFHSIPKNYCMRDLTSMDIGVCTYVSMGICNWCVFSCNTHIYVNVRNANNNKVFDVTVGMVSFGDG